MKFQGFIGPTYKLDSVNVDCQRCVNLIPELIESGTGKEGQVSYYFSSPGLKELFTVGTGPIRLIHIDDPKKSPLNPDNRMFIASGSEMFLVWRNGASWEIEKLGDLETSTGPMRAASAQNDLGVTVFVDGTTNYLYWRYNSGDGMATQDFGTFGDFGYPGVPTATHVIWIDGYFIFNEKDTGQFWVSDWNSISVSPLSFASAEGNIDSIVALIANNRNLVILNSKTIEVWSNTGNADFPFERIQGGFIEKGCLAPFSVAKIEGAVFWIGRDEFGQGTVYLSEGLNPQRISTHAVERAIRSYADLGSATAYTYSTVGHSYYVLNFSEGTWVFDLSTKLWHEWLFTEGGELLRHRGEAGAFFPHLGIQLAGDFETGKVYQIDENTYTDDGAAITRMRVSPHMSASTKRLFFHSLQIDMETGVGLDGSVQGSDPQAMLDWSNDGGHTWSSEVMGSIGKKVGGIGDFKKRVKFNRLGSAYDRVFRLKITDPVRVTILGADIELEAGVS